MTVPRVTNAMATTSDARSTTARRSCRAPLPRWRARGNCKVGPDDRRRHLSSCRPPRARVDDVVATLAPTRRRHRAVRDRDGVGNLVALPRVLNPDPPRPARGRSPAHADIAARVDQARSASARSDEPVGQRWRSAPAFDEPRRVERRAPWPRLDFCRCADRYVECAIRRFAHLLAQRSASRTSLLARATSSSPRSDPADLGVLTPSP